MRNKKSEITSVDKNLTGQLGALFVQRLLAWNKKSNTRQMPWKGEKDPYKIWISEIILQQTRVQQGLKYYENFITAFPDVHALSKAPERQVFKLWEGLGYYSRCRNLMATANFVARDLQGVFPKDFASILQLKGVGDYTASAIASFAYDLPHAVVDGNVFRVLSRVFDIEMPIDSAGGKKYFSQLAHDILPKEKAGEYNQAIMDFGAVICKPHPDCGTCFFTPHCKAYLLGKQDLLPVKEKQIKIKERWLNYFVVKYKDEFLIRQRTSKDVWQHLFEFVLIETGKPHNETKLSHLFATQFALLPDSFRFLYVTEQKLSHQLIHFSFVEISLSKKTKIPGFFWVKSLELNKYAFPKTLQEFVTSSLNQF